jgi:hypothetical protein
MTDNPEILFMVTELIKAYQEDYINKNKTEPTETFVKTSMMPSLLAAETVVELNEFNMHGSLHNVLSEIKLIEDKKIKFENQETKINFDVPQGSSVNQKDTKGTVFYEVCEGQIKEKDKYLDPKFETNFDPKSTSNFPQKTIQAKLTNGVKNKVSLNLNNYLTSLGTKDISKYDVEKCLKCKVDWKDIGFDLPSLEWSLDFSQLLKTINDAIDKLMKEMDPSKIYDQLCLFIKGFDKFSLCPSQLPQIAAILPALFIKYTNDVMKLQFDWLFLFGPIVKFLTGALANLIENIPKLTKPIIMCLVNGVESMKRFWNFYSDFLKKNGKQIKSIAEGLMLTGQTLYKLVKDKWTFNNDPAKPTQQQNKTTEAPKQNQQLKSIEERLPDIIKKNVAEVINLMANQGSGLENTNDFTNLLHNNSEKISSCIESRLIFADFLTAALYSYNPDSTKDSDFTKILVFEVLNNVQLFNAMLNLDKNTFLTEGKEFLNRNNAINYIVEKREYNKKSTSPYYLKDEDNKELILKNRSLRLNAIKLFQKSLCDSFYLSSIKTNMRKLIVKKRVDLKLFPNPFNNDLSNTTIDRFQFLQLFFRELAIACNTSKVNQSKEAAGYFRSISENIVVITNLLVLQEDVHIYYERTQKDANDDIAVTNSYSAIIDDVFGAPNIFDIKSTENQSDLSEKVTEQINEEKKIVDNGVIISFNSKGEPITLPSNEKALLEKELKSKNKLSKVTTPSTFLQKQLSQFLNKNVINPLNEKSPNSALLKKYGLEGKVILDKPPELVDYIAIYEENIDRPINLVLDNIILALKETQNYIEDFTGSVINALKAINEAFNRKINLTLQLGGRILNIIHTIRFVLLIYKLIQKGFTDCEKISDNIQGAQSIVNSVNPDLKLDNVASNEAKNIISNLNPQASNFEGVDEKRYLAITSETNQSSTLINVTDCNNLGSKMRLDNDENLNRLYEELYNAHITT